MLTTVLTGLVLLAQRALQAMIAVGASLRLGLAAQVLGRTYLLLNLQDAKWNNNCTC